MRKRLAGWRYGVGVREEEVSDSRGWSVVEGALPYFVFQPEKIYEQGGFSISSKSLIKSKE